MRASVDAWDERGAVLDEVEVVLEGFWEAWDEQEAVRDEQEAVRDEQEAVRDE